MSYENEAKLLDILSSMTVPVNTQKLIWLAEGNRCISIYGVKGTPLSKLDNLTVRQKQSIGEQIGIFLKRLHAQKADFCTEDEILRRFTLDCYGADEALRKKVEIKYDMSTITCPKFGIPLWGEGYIVEKRVPLIRKVMSKYKNEIKAGASCEP